MAKVWIDDQEIELGDNERLNGIEAARRVGVEVPHYCWHPGLSVVASCRMCLVECGTKNSETGEVSMLPKLVPACQTPAKDGTVMVTNSEKVAHARAFVEEALLIDHPIDCPICDKAGECNLQDYHFEHGQQERRADIKPFTSRRRSMGETVTLFVDRCVMCSRCVRFCREVTGTNELMVVQRGAHEEIDVFPGFPLENKLSGNVVDLCPVGALGDSDFLYSQRVWFMKTHNGVCTGCSTGCSIQIDENQDKVYRIRPRTNPHVNQWWMCDDGRYNWRYIHDDARLIGPSVSDPAVSGNGASSNGDGSGLGLMEWSTVIARVDDDVRTAGKMAVVLSPHLTVEEAYLLCTYARDVDPDALIAVGPAPVVGEDETFSQGFTIRAEKCPNRRGVEEVAAVFGKRLTLDELLPKITRDGIQTVWVTGGYPQADWMDEATANQLAAAQMLVVQDIADSPLWQVATHKMPSATFAEKEGSYVNFSNRLQSVPWAIRPPAGARTEGSVYWQLLGRSGLYQSKIVLKEVASEIAFFRAAGEDVGEHGVDLTIDMLAGA
ncbi:MAG: 2Fe-2S iron-sulfur cluster-binding protein [Pirellulales bacterium]|nr:2Fe-2S iron-sulfur cluster-binding protein [Pirellulales bacterium]